MYEDNIKNKVLKIAYLNLCFLLNSKKKNKLKRKNKRPKSLLSGQIDIDLSVGERKKVAEIKKKI